MWLAGQAICASSLFVASQAGAVRQGPLGPTSTGSIGITISIASPVRTSAPNEIHFGALAKAYSETSQHLCLSRNTTGHSFGVSATGSGTAGALVLSDGHRNVPYHVKFASPADTAPGDNGGTRDGSRGGCEHGQRAIAFVVAIDPERVDEIQAGTGFAGILTLIVVPG
jgi:hypothetical protein